MSAGRALSRSLALWPGWQGLRLPPLPPAACQHTSSCLSPCHLSRAPAAPGAWEEWLVASGPGGGLWVQVHECCEFSLCVGVAGRRSLLRSSGSLAWGPSPHCGRLAEPGKVVPSMGRGRWALGAGRWVGSRFCAERRAVSEASGAAMELGGAWLPVAPTAGGGERAGGWVGSEDEAGLNGAEEVMVGEVAGSGPGSPHGPDGPPGSTWMVCQHRGDEGTLQAWC